ncbi:MAG: hypothetical protein GXX79_07945, partial [Actinomycetales bacterium]|nr:hypothetical protein [Actinomycetales bacterium]
MSGFGLPDRDGLPPAGSGTTRRGVITAGAAVLVLGACTDSSAPGGSPSPPTPDEIA